MIGIDRSREPQWVSTTQASSILAGCDHHVIQPTSTKSFNTATAVGRLSG